MDLVALLTIKHLRKVNIEKLLAKLVFTITITIILGVSYRSNICNIMKHLCIIYPFQMMKTQTVKTGLPIWTKHKYKKKQTGHSI